MLKLNDRQIIEYLLRCFTSVDGLWFMKLEEKSGFDTALDIDNDVWQVMPKIQARLLKSMAKLGNGIEAMIDTFAFKMMLEGFTFETEKIERPQGFSITVIKCPWLDLMLKSKRGTLAGKIGTTICHTDSSAWAAEFGDNIKFELKHQMCTGSADCVLQFNC